MASVEQVRLEFVNLLAEKNVSEDVIHNLLHTEGEIYIGEHNQGLQHIHGFCNSSKCDECSGEYCNLRLYPRKKSKTKTIIGLTTNIIVEAKQVRCARSNICNDELNFSRNFTLLEKDVQNTPRIYVHYDNKTEEIFSIGHRGNVYITRGVVC